MRQEGVKLFIIWYQILSTNAKQNVHHLFASLVPGLVPEISNPFIQQTTNSHLQLNNPQIPLIQNVHSTELADVQRIKLGNLNETQNNLANLANQQVHNLNFNNAASSLPSSYLINNNPIFATEIEPMIPSLVHETQPNNHTTYYLQQVLNFMVNQVHRIQWTEDRDLRYNKCFRFLFEQFNQVYLRNIFPELDDNFSFYEPSLVLPNPRIIDLEEKLNYNPKRFQFSNTLQDCKSRVIMWFAKFMKTNQIDKNKIFEKTNGNFFNNLDANDGNLNSNVKEIRNLSEPNVQPINSAQMELSFVYSFLTSTRSNVNLVHQILNQAFLMPFTQSETMREVVSVYREWIYKNYNQVPIFLDEPDNQFNNKNDVRAGLSSFHCIFITYSANVFLLKGIPMKQSFLGEQVEMCKRVLNVYRYMVMKVDMDKKTWEQLLLVVLRITSLVLTEQLPAKKEDTLGGRLAPAFFETLIVTLIKANLNIFVSMELWDRFQSTLKSLTAWEELIKEWARTMDTLTRVMSRYVYNINLYDLPLERPTNRKNKRQVSRGKTVGQVNFNPKVHNLTNENSTVDDASRKSNNYPFNNQNFNESIGSNKSNMSNQMNQFSVQTSNGKHRHQNKSSSTLSQNSDKNVHKSFSDSNLVKLNHDECQKMLKSKTNDEFKSYMENFSGLDNCDSEAIKHRLNNIDKQNLKSKSLINISAFNIHNHSNDLDSEIQSLNQSRSPSPVSCNNTNLETNNSLKETLNLDGLSIATNTANYSNQPYNQSHQKEDSNRSVISGGSYKNWSPDSAVILWRRMLNILGDINDFKEPKLHLLAFHCLAKIVEDFLKIRDNLGIIIDQSGNFQQNLDFFPTHVPPLDYFVSWLFEATFLDDSFKEGKLIAYRLLCIIATRKHESLMDNVDFLTMFYHTIHNGLNSCDMEIISIIVRSCKARLFSFSLPGNFMHF